MGNNASSPKASGPGGGQQQHQHHLHHQHHEGSASSSGSAISSSSRPVQYHQQMQQQQQQQLQQSQAQSQPKTARNPALVQSQSTRVSPAPPEPSITHAQGSNCTSSPMQPRSYSSAAEAAEAAVAHAAGAGVSSSPAGPAKPTDIKPRALDIRNTPPRSDATAGAYYPNFRSQITSEALAQAVAGPSGGGVNTATTITRTDSEPPLSPYADSTDVSTLAHTNSMQDVSYLTRPPRLPLPIEEEVHTPGSPIIAASRKVSGDPVDDIEALDPDGMTPRSSTLSSGTNDDDDMEELRVDKTRPTVPTRLEWNGGGEKVYVTGTIFQWSRKQRLHKVEGRPGVFATTINVLPGTHHIRFLVDGQIETSRNLPTTVDFGNNLVNYIEVEAPSTPPKRSGATSPSSPDEEEEHFPSSITRTAAQQDEYEKERKLRQKQRAKEKKEREQQRQRIAEEKAAAEAAEVAKAKAAAAAAAAAAEADQLTSTDSSAALTNKLPKWKDLPEPEAFSNELPQYLLDYDQPDESPIFHQAAAATEVLTQPPSLPGFLGKPILNAATLIKDDNSVLNMPNYTILNHLATSSIKNNILAVSATTRYKGKFVTIIIYKPTGGDDKP